MMVAKIKLTYPTNKLREIEKALQDVTTHLVDHGRVLLGTPESKKLIWARSELLALISKGRPGD